MKVLKKASDLKQLYQQLLERYTVSGNNSFFINHVYLLNNFILVRILPICYKTTLFVS